MKKLVSLLAALCLIAGLSTTVWADPTKGEVLTESPAVLDDLTDKALIGVFGTYDGGKPGGDNGTDLDDGGDGELELPDGTEVEIDGDEDIAYWRVVVIPVTKNGEPTAYEWAADKVKSLDREPVIYYVMFYYGNEQREPPRDAKITITIRAAGDFNKTTLYFMTGDGVPMMDNKAKISGNTATFNTGDTGASHTGYYIFTKSGHGSGGRPYRPGLIQPTQTGVTTEDVTSPKTGDAGIAVYAALSLLSLTGGAWIGKKKEF